jgi:ACS family tartrate transporter-like MFS transporter
LIGNVGGLVGPYLIGLIRTQSGSFAGPVWFVAAVMASGAIFISLLQVSERRFARGQ